MTKPYEHIFSIDSKEDLIRCFRVKDQNKLLLPENIRFPFRIRSYFTWKEPAGNYTYLVFKMPNWDLPRGVAFKRMTSTGEPIGGLCSWCHAYGSSDEIGFLSVTMSSNVSSSYLICQDLSCIDKIEDAAAMSGKDPEKHIQDLLYKMGKLFENISNYKPD